MKLMTKAIEAKFAKTGSQETKGTDAVIIAKFFNPMGNQRWYATEFDAAERLFFGWVNLGDSENAELGSFSLDELQSVRGPLGLGIERDLYFGEHTLAEVISGDVR